jgi:hypothetical protein
LRSLAIVVAVFSASALLIALSRLISGRRIAAAGNGVLAVVLGLLAFSLLNFSSNLRVYGDYIVNEPVAEIVFERTAPGNYRATLTRLPGGRMKIFVISGDEWRLDGHILEWKKLPARLGLQSRYRLDGLSTRYLGLQADSLIAPERYSLSGASHLCPWLRKPRDWLIAATPQLFGPWRPLADRARFQLSLGPNGIEARPANESAEKAVLGRR